MMLLSEERGACCSCASSPITTLRKKHLPSPTVGMNFSEGGEDGVTWVGPAGFSLIARCGVVLVGRQSGCRVDEFRLVCSWLT